MALNSVNTNTGALIALQNLSLTNKDLNDVQARISTGLKVASAKDNGAIWAIAQNQRATINAFDSVKSSLQRGQSVVDVAVSAGETVSDLLSQMKAKALAASDLSLDTTSRTALNEDYKSLRDQVAKVVANADFNGANMISATATTVKALANAAGTSVLTVQAQNMTLGGAIVTVTATASFNTATTAGSQLTAVNNSLTNVSAAVSKLGTGSNSLQTHLNFISDMQDAMVVGVSNLVDADVAKESAKLQALQTKQQLGVQALSIANSSTSILLALFR